MQSALIVGGDSTIGKPLVGYLRAKKIEVATTSRKKEAQGSVWLDLTETPSNWPELPQVDVAYLCAAATKLDQCEQDPAATQRINVEHMQALAQRLLESGAFVVFLSTNQVFDGMKPYRKAEEVPSPRNEYGRQKAAFETWLLAQAKPAAILRLTKVIPGPLPIFEKWQEALSAGKPVDAFADLRFAPLPIQQVIEGMYQLGVKKHKGIYQLSGVREVSYFDIAREMAKRMGADTALVKKNSAKDAGIREAFLPPYGTLDMETMPGIKVPEAFDAVFADAA